MFFCIINKWTRNYLTSNARELVLPQFSCTVITGEAQKVTYTAHVYNSSKITRIILLTPESNFQYGYHYSH